MEPWREHEWAGSSPCCEGTEPGGGGAPGPAAGLVTQWEHRSALKGGCAVRTDVLPPTCPLSRALHRPSRGRDSAPAGVLASARPTLRP